MISLRKILVTLLAPLGAVTIIGTGFATWTFGLEDYETIDPITNDVNITAEVTNGKVSILECPSVLVFSEGTQGPLDLFDGISFYSDKVIIQGIEFNVSLLDASSTHAVSLIYDNIISPAKLYYSWTEDKNSQNLSSTISGELTSSDAQANSYYGTWTGQYDNGGQNIDVTIRLEQSEIEGGLDTGSISFTRNNVKVDDAFTFERSGTIAPNITITDSTLSFRYDYDNKFLVDEDETGYRLNTKMKMSLNSSEPFNVPCVKETAGNSLRFSQTTGSLKSFKLSKNENNLATYDLELTFNLGGSNPSKEQKVNFTGMTLSENSGGDTVFPNGLYTGTSTTDIPCNLRLTQTGENSFNAEVELGAMDHYLKIVDSYQNMVDDEGYFNISENKTYAQTSLNFNIDESHLNDKKPYIVYTCQLARLIGYASSDVKPTDETKYFGLQVATTLGGWQLKIEVCADFTSTRG